MIYLDFKNALAPLGVFSLKDIEKIFPVSSVRLHKWNEKGYITKIKNGWYVFSDEKRTELFVYFAANRIYAPSYISLESALSYHGIIPEAVYDVNSVSTIRTMTYKTPLCNMNYRTIKTEAFTGYDIIDHNTRPVKIATPEKAIVDFLYLRNYTTENELLNLRFDFDNVSKEKIIYYTNLFNSKKLKKNILDLFNAYDI